MFGSFLKFFEGILEFDKAPRQCLEGFLRFFPEFLGFFWEGLPRFSFCLNGFWLSINNPMKCTWPMIGV